MKALKISLIALSTLALSSAAMAHGWQRGHRENRREVRYEERYEQRHEERREDRYEGRYGRETRCESPERVAYVEPRIEVRPGVKVRVTFGF